jgi:hypothetical protein
MSIGTKNGSLLRPLPMELSLAESVLIASSGERR